MQFIITMLTSEVVWAAIIASGLTFLGVTLSNRSNRKSLEMQLNHVAREKDKEREMRLRRDVYLQGIEAIADAIQDIIILPRIIGITNEISIGDKMIAAVAKIHMVATLDTIEALNSFMKVFNEVTLPIVPEVTKYTVIKGQIDNLNQARQIREQQMDKTLNKLDEINKSERHRPEMFDGQMKIFDNIMEEHNTILAKIENKPEQLKGIHRTLLGMCLKAASALQKESLNCIVSIRKELELEIDCKDYFSKMEKVFMISENLNSPEILDELIYKHFEMQ